MKGSRAPSMGSWGPERSMVSALEMDLTVHMPAGSLVQNECFSAKVGPRRASTRRYSFVCFFFLSSLGEELEDVVGFAESFY